MKRALFASIVLAASCRPPSSAVPSPASPPLAIPPATDAPLNNDAAARTISPEREIAARLSLKPRFAFGLGNDAAADFDPNKVGAYTIGPKVDIHYMYLSGFDWPEWNKPEGRYITLHVDAAKARDVVPMFTLYQAAAWGEGNLNAFNDNTFMTKYWRGVRVMLARLADSNVPVIAHIEPDLWGYFQQKRSDDPANAPVKVHELVTECADLRDDAGGFGRCIVRLARKLAPKVVIGFSASTFGAYTGGEPDAERVATYLRNVGGSNADIVIVETLDRDAGCFEAAIDPKCQRKGKFYWTDVDFTKHLAWTKTIREVTGRPLLWWQMPLGVPSNTPGGSSGHYRDNRVAYAFQNAWRFAQAGGIGAVFGEGARNQTTVKTDGGQFRDALTKYLASGGNRLN